MTPAELFSHVAEIIGKCMGIDPQNIRLEDQLLSDLGVAGDDAIEIFQSLDQKFDVDWGDLDHTIHFGTEGIGYPFPWRLKDSCWLNEVQPMSVAELVKAVADGRWAGTQHIPVSTARRIWLYVASTTQWLLFLAVLVGAIWSQLQ